MIIQEEKEKKSPMLIFSYAFFAISILLAVGIFLLTTYYDKKVDKLQGEISTYENSINVKKENKEIQVYSLLQENKKVIDLMDKKSKIKVLVDHVRSIESVYGIKLSGFNYNNGLLSFGVVAPFSVDSYASDRVSNFIKSYREDKNALFTLDFINSFTGFDSMNFSISLKLK
ncbi:MAG: hypothetical protein PHN31_00175 [Candidatus Gracilibacteria bacterium]|nr:hypothetical protein [Candidatus Gracilibacteria bacterium]